MRRSGKVIIFITGLIKQLIKPRRSPAMRIICVSPVKLTASINSIAAKRASMPIAVCTAKFLNKE